MVLFLIYLQRVLSIDSRNIVFVIVSQTAYDNTGDPYKNPEDRLKQKNSNGNSEIDDSVALKSKLKYYKTVDGRAAKQLKNDIYDQVMAKEQRHPIVHITNEDFPISGAWTIIPLLLPLFEKYEVSDVRWILFIEPYTVVKYPKLIEALNAAENNGRTMWTGYALRTTSFRQHMLNEIYNGLTKIPVGLPYPYFASGFAMRMKLINMVVHRKIVYHDGFYPSMTDPSFELACAVYGDDYYSGPLFKPNTRFCAFPGDDCATYPRKFNICGEAVPEESMYFAVKTYHKYHHTRVKVIRRTWGQYISNLMFYSDIADPSLPAIDTGVPNIGYGHCLKTVAILKHAVSVTENTKHIKWIILIDDDAVLGVQRLCEILSCYQGGESFTMLGERYRLRLGNTTNNKLEGECRCRVAVWAQRNHFGHDFITGGSGIVLSLAAARLLTKCDCVNPDNFDDVRLGSCAKEMELSLSHSPLFHQFFPEYYQQEVLERDRPVSFHECSPRNVFKCSDVYDQWFKADDLKLKRRRPREEL